MTGGRCFAAAHLDHFHPPRVLRPNVQRTQVPRCSPDTLVVRARTQRPNMPFRSLSVEETPRVYEQLYADEFQFRKATGK